MATFSLQYVVPIVLIVSAYSLIVYDLNFNNQTAPSSKYVEQIKRKENIRISKLAVSMSIVCAFCLLPHHTIALWLEFGDGSTSKHVGDINLVAYFILYLNSAVDPLLYNVFNSNFKRELKKLSLASNVDNNPAVDNYSSVPTQWIMLKGKKKNHITSI